MADVLSNAAFWNGCLAGGVATVILVALVFRSVFWPEKEAQSNGRPRYR